MKYRVERQAAFVLHSRPYRDTSSLLDLFTLEHGKVSVVCRGGRRPSSKMRAVLQPFTTLQVSWQGRNDLKSLTLAECTIHNGLLSGDALICALYVNELLQKLLQVFDPHPKLFVYYQYLIKALSQNDIEIPLRIFERKLLSELGYKIDLSTIETAAYYQYNAVEQRLEKVLKFEQRHASRYFYGQYLLAIEQEDYQSREVRLVAKRLMRLQLDVLLNGKVLNSRALLAPKKRAESHSGENND